jgi:calcineurin-like phosphoesterase family protein
VRFYTSDLHLGHRRISELAGRPFTSVEEMDETLVGRWNETVDAGDEVWVLGDVAMGKIDESLALCRSLSGHKHLILGNHDRPFMERDKPAKRAAWMARYLDEGGFDYIAYGGCEVLALPGGARVVVELNHFPYRGDSQNVDRYLDARPVDRGDWLLCGHVHEKWRQRDRMINVGVDVRDFRPVAEPTLTAIIAADASPHV